ncbi:MAG: Serine-tRNA ligase [Candidatus Moranbacteria bacterium GW2011_GWF2_36_839]|nr:MAG: Serine-tRNA ligase [Candidatus Moranbacteria bacterium GW2011_GWF1_36_78]KKQ15867.1 MAG: Serine-tRNA ligase [Candidatus Moranbacteria bacterium GW2011_GWF2_36_839]HAT74408.1 serine--tRNA ligase [Candidatus Moranbacteria bacterium]HBY11105.1 serine--tRNA ligase [Candidatus Moranbacteria bacterium]
MLDIKFIRENADKIKEAIKNKNIDLDLDGLLETDGERVRALQYIEELNAEKNVLNDLIQKSQGDERKTLIEQGKAVKEKMAIAEPEYLEIKKHFDDLMVKVPVIPAEDVPVGKSEKENVEIYTWGEIPKFDFEIKDHIQLGKDLDILDLERGAKVSGYRGYYVKNEGVSLMMGFMMYALQKMISKGYSPMIVPTLVKEFPLFGSGYFKGKEYNPEIDEIYQVASSDKEADGEISRDKKFLVGTAEPSLLAYHSGEVLKEEDLPMKLCGYSQCYRSEIGSYGKDTKGLYRVHEFMKVEQIILSKANIEESDALQQEMVGISKEMHEELGLPYRQLKICTGDMSAGKYKMFDIEAWIPSRNGYGETGSASNFLDWQSRRLNVKYVDKNGEKKYIYMLNNTALASPRTFISIIENYQQADGSVLIPEVLKKYMPEGMERIIRK